MTLSPFNLPFFSCISSSQIQKRDFFLCKAKECLSQFDFNMFCDILEEWESCPTLDSCFSRWKEFIPSVEDQVVSSLHILSFNVRGLNLRWQEVLLLLDSYKFDVLVLLETGFVDISFYSKIFSNFKLYFQHGENRNGGVLVLIRNDFSVKRIPCDIPNVCVLDILGEKTLRLCGMYAPDSKSWKWEDLSPFLTRQSVILGDFNVDLDQDTEKADSLLSWADDHFLVPYSPDTPTSMRSDRVIDYALASGFKVDIQCFSGNTTSDHIPIISIIPFQTRKPCRGKNTHWKVFSLFSEFSFSFWEKTINEVSCMNSYNDYIRFLSLLSSRCTIFFDLKKYRSAIPCELRSFLSYIRALSFRQLKLKCPHLGKEINSLRKIVKKELKSFFSNQLDVSLNHRNSSSPLANSFWFKCKKYLKPSSSSLHGLINPEGKVAKDPHVMCDIAADFYETFFKKSSIIRPHPYTDSPPIDYDNKDELIPIVTIDELLNVVQSIRKKKSSDAHGISSFMFKFLDQNHWSLLLPLFNCSFETALFPSNWKDTRVILLAKKDPVCPPSLTRPISLVDCFQKICERLFLSRFRSVLFRRGILPDCQSGFREHFRLQTRVLLFLEDVFNLMSNSSPVASIFIDFKSAFDQLWFLGCVGKLKRLGIPLSYCRWIESWLSNRRCFIEIGNKRSRWFEIEKGGPQGSVFTPTLFITYHSDLDSFLPNSINHLFADDLVGVIAGQIGLEYGKQCLDLEKRCKNFLDYLEYYSLLTDQPINLDKSVAMFSARAVGNPKFEIHFNYITQTKISWVPEFKYLGYIISSKLGWSKFLKSTIFRIRQRVCLIRSFKLFGCTSPLLRKTLFSSFVLPLFTWIYPIFPLLTKKPTR